MPNNMYTNRQIWRSKEKERMIKITDAKEVPEDGQEFFRLFVQLAYGITYNTTSLWREPMCRMRNT